MLSRSFRSQDQTRIDKSARLKKHRDPKASKRSLKGDRARPGRPHDPPSAAPAPSPIVTLAVGREARLFAAHEDVLRQAPFFDIACRGAPSPDPRGTRISLPDEEPEVFSAVLEFLYKGDYYPRLVRDSSRDTWELEDASPYSPGPGRSPASVSSRPTSDATVRLSSAGDEVLRDTAIYCAADRYGLEDLKLLSLRKQGLQSGIDVGTILRSAAYAYAHTPDSDSRLRAHYLALIIRCRRTFKRSGTMQIAMEEGGSKLFFDLFVAMCNHLDDVMEVGGHSPRPRGV